MRDQRGYSLIEVLAALAILTLVITVSMAAFLERNNRLRQARELILAYQALSNEAEYVRRVDFGSLKSTTGFQSDLTLLEPLGPVETEIDVRDTVTGVKSVMLIIRWREKVREARLELVRVETGGSNLW